MADLGTPPEEFPSPHAEPKAMAPGTDPIARKIIERQREGEPGEGGDMKEALDAVDPVTAGTKTQLDPASPRPAPEG